MNRYSKFLLLILSFGILFTSCKTQKATKGKRDVVKDTATTVIPEKNASAYVVKKLEEHYNTFQYYFASGSANIESPDQKVELDISITMEKDSYIMMVATAVLGIEAARILITNDSISILNRLQRTHTVTDFRYLEKLTGVKMNLGQIQQLILGNPPFAPNASKMLLDSAASYLLITQMVSPEWKQTLFVNRVEMNTSRVILSDQSGSKELKVSYQEFHTHTKNNYPSDLNINIRAEKNMDCRFKLTYFAFDKTKEINFVVPKSYKTIRI